MSAQKKPLSISQLRKQNTQLRDELAEANDAIASLQEQNQANFQEAQRARDKLSTLSESIREFYGKVRDIYPDSPMYSDSIAQLCELRLAFVNLIQEARNTKEKLERERELRKTEQAVSEKLQEIIQEALRKR